mmetsp:Transcript_12410/g.31150  ORF Transcript_12410/g.31150 Transcript_12410/m.31150 type:complete len:886 (-) Transcript_12410:127-2784(-)
MFSSISTEPEKVKRPSNSTEPRKVQVVIACGRPLLHVRSSPLPPISMPTMSLHLERHKVQSALSASGIEMEVQHLPEFTRNSLAMHIEEAEEDPDIVIMCGSGTSWDDGKLLVEDGFASADLVDLGDLHLVIPKRPKLLVGIGNFSHNFGKLATEEGVAPVVILLNDTEAVGSADSYEFLSLVLKGLVRSQEKMTIKQSFDQVAQKFQEEKRPATYAAIFTALRAMAPPRPLPVMQGTCRVLDMSGMAALRARQNPRVFRQLGFDGRSQEMWAMIDGMERTCAYNKVIISGSTGSGRTEIAAQLVLWMIDRAKVTCAICASCDKQADVAHSVKDVNSLYDMFGALLTLGMAARKQDDLRKAVLLRTLRSVRAVLWIDDWQSLAKKERANVAQLLSEFPPNVRVIVTCRGEKEHEMVKSLEAMLPDAMHFPLPDLNAALSQKMFFTHMERVMFGDDHVSNIEFENRFHKSGPCSKLGDLDKESRAMLKDTCDNRLGSFGQSHVLALHLLAASSAAASSVRTALSRFRDEQEIDYGFIHGPEEPHCRSDALFLWPAMCVSHYFLSEEQRRLAIILVRVGAPLHPDELAQVSGYTPKDVVGIINVLYGMRIVHRTPTGLVYVIPAIRSLSPTPSDQTSLSLFCLLFQLSSHFQACAFRKLCSCHLLCGPLVCMPLLIVCLRFSIFVCDYHVLSTHRDNIMWHMSRRSRMEKETGGLFRLDDFRSEPWVRIFCSVVAGEVLKATLNFFSVQGGAWSELMAAHHMRLAVEALSMDASTGAGGQMTLLYDMYFKLVRAWFFEWERGGIKAPGGFEAGLDGRHIACRPIPVHYVALRNALMQVQPLASNKERQRAACEAMASILFSIGEYEGAEGVTKWATSISQELAKKPY